MKQAVVVPAAAVLGVLESGGVDGRRVIVLLPEELRVVESDVDWVGVDVALVGRRWRHPGIREVEPELVPEPCFVPPDHRTGLEEEIEFRSCSKIK